MTDGIDAAVNAMEAAALKSMIDSPSADPESDELRPRHHPMLGRRQLRDRLIAGFPPYSVVNCALDPHEAQIGGPRRTVG
jgi:hypothetical protein